MSTEAAARIFFSSPLFAVVGASSNPAKFGHKIFAWYHAQSISATPVNPTAATVTALGQEHAAVPNLSALPRPKETSVSIITPPAATLKVLKEARELGIPAVWLQPGSFDDAVIAYAREEGAFNAVVAGDGGRGHEGWCVLVDGERALKAAEYCKLGTVTIITMDHKHEEPTDSAYNGGLMHPSDEHLDKNATRDEALRRMRTAGSISISPELFEKLYLSPQNVVKGDLRKTFGNPTPIGSYFFFGGLLMFLGGLLEWILGNAFPSVVFLTFSAFWLSFGATLVPDFHAYAAYAPADATSVAEGLQTRGFNASFGFFLLAMMLLCLVYLVCSLRTNVAFFIIFLTLVLGFGLLTGAYWALASDYTGNAAFANKLIKGGGACYFVTCLAGWWIFVAILLAILEFPFQLPVGDLSQLFAKKEVRNKSNV
ncbi:hypothetical protein BN1708_010541 [Verticillium longisporum]|uniref:CoA-binding domain-containing protein n=1 Tax=Verticillium longisporum TaxID=100787 RepID=A0A0G4KSC2_VERLO|nr:hypothetical protein BN1708_010541 [Verticillium longisporum]